MDLPILGALLAACAFAQMPDYDQGVSLVQKGQPAAAVPFLIRAAEAHPQQARAWAALGIAYATQGKYDLAEPPFHRACELDPKLEDACYYEGRTLYALDRFEASIQALQRAASTNINSWKIHLGLAQALEALGRAADAEKEFLKTRSLTQNNDPQPESAYGLFLIRQGRPEEATELLREVLKRFPSCAEAHLQLGRAMLERGKISEAIPHLEQAVELEPGSAQAHLLLAKAYVRSGRVADAQLHFEAAAHLEESSQNARK